MKILVCISCVPDTTSKINFTNNDTDFDTNGVQFVINPNDEFGLTRAMWFKEKNNASIDVINVGEQSNETVLRKALAIGADRAIRIDSKAIDSYQVAKNISNFIKEKSYDLIIAGRESIDYNGSMVPGMISEILNLNFITNCVSLEINGSNATAKREMEGGIETLTCELPLIIGGQKGLVEESDLIIPNMRGIMMARQKPLEVLSAKNIKARAIDKKYFKPQEKAEVKLIKPDELDKLIDLLANEAKVI